MYIMFIFKYSIHDHCFTWLVICCAVVSIDEVHTYVHTLNLNSKNFFCIFSIRLIKSEMLTLTLLQPFLYV